MILSNLTRTELGCRWGVKSCQEKRGLWFEQVLCKENYNMKCCKLHYLATFLSNLAQFQETRDFILGSQIAVLFNIFCRPPLWCFPYQERRDSWSHKRLLLWNSCPGRISWRWYGENAPTLAVSGWFKNKRTWCWRKEDAFGCFTSALFYQTREKSWESRMLCHPPWVIQMINWWRG